ncbi:hypothetical protein [Glycomyces tritici]|uniref:Secreted protein n=1 Tax=Glycomyces tritici TaxID=2665176 RepID=A0ABT7YVB8_9ACTN|nr:hypothetical protein [Glycomyces tritici]MDN3242574.1 hypothetical protein [Glycomyces tritici]
MRLLKRVALAIALALTVIATTPALPAAATGPALVPLVSFFSPTRGDHFTTTQSTWTCKYFRTCAADPGYRAVGIQGFVYNPANPQPANSVPLYHWWSAARGDNFLTTDPNWAGEVGDRRTSGDEYVLFRIEGYVSTLSPSGAEPLRSYWNPALGDNAAMATWRPWTPVPSGWTLHRTEGFLLPPPGAPLVLCTSDVSPDDEDPSAWNAYGNQVTDWQRSANLLDGDALKVTAAPGSVIRVDYWGREESVFGDLFSHNPGGPAPELAPYSLIGRVDVGAMYVHGWGWYEAGAWFPAIGTVHTGTPCMVYESLGGTSRKLQLSFNDSNLGDNGGYAPVTVAQWW